MTDVELARMFAHAGDARRTGELAYDPDYFLATIKAMAETWQANREAGKQDLADLVDRLCERVLALDAALSAGGELPKRWRR